MEGSPFLNGFFLRENLFDELVLNVSPIIGEMIKIYMKIELLKL